MTTSTETAGKQDHKINIFINDLHVKVETAHATGAGIARVDDVPDGNQIFLDVAGPGDERSAVTSRSSSSRSCASTMCLPATSADDPRRRGREVAARSDR